MKYRNNHKSTGVNFISETENLETYFAAFRKDIVGIEQKFDSFYGTQKILYADWTASGRLYKPIEDKLLYEVGLLWPIPTPKLRLQVL
jgi:hypothetical protein